MYYFQSWSCPYCRCPVEVRLFSVCSGLGPAAVGCLRCGEPVPLDRREWPDMTGRARARFVAVSLLYAGMVGLLTGNFIDQTVQLWEQRPEIINLHYGSPVFQAAALAGGAAVVPLQAYRVWLSRRRHARGDGERRLTAREFFGGLQWNLQAKCLLLLVLVWSVAKARYAE